MVCSEKYKIDNKFLTKLPDYTLVSVLARITFVSIIAIIIIRLMAQIKEDNVPQQILVLDYIKIIIAYNVLSELMLLLDRFLERLFPIPEKIKPRLFFQMLGSILLIVAVYNLSLVCFFYEEKISKSMFYISLALGLVFVNILSSSLLLTRLLEKWVFAQKRMDELKQEKLKMDYNALQDQLNPHFLFNNMSVLKSLIMYEKDSALKFTDNLTDVYRYVLQSKDKKTVRVKTELDFIESYLGLHKERLGEGLEVKFSIEEACLNREIAPLSLQLLLENAIKHNIVSSDLPLVIEVDITGNTIWVKNNLNLKDKSYSTQTGLRNLIRRYQMLTKEDIVIEQTEEYFSVKVPLI